MTARRRRLATIALAICACLALLLVGLGWVLDGGRIQIEVERARRLAYAAMGARLPGTPDLDDFDGRLAASGLELGAPVLLRIFKLEFELEVWMKRGHRFERFAVYPICRWSGGLGPKLREGDWQAPEGFYTVDANALNPASRWHRSFNLGFPNAFDRAHGRTGSYLMVHGGCSSIGCFAMTDAVIDEIWRLVTAALKRGQRRFHVHVFPFRMTQARMAQHSHGSWAGFWRDLKPGYDLFEATGLPPTISVCRDRYMAAPAAPDTQGSSEIDHACSKATGTRS
ncbi:MAG TPA: murein L,D-transpeptidase family protein [Hyphomicrobiaceae bacterium]|nr:murein L,D-transpeptidase family protein [Hyphomicrobiaceae bacterium]